MLDKLWCASCTKAIEGEPKVVKGSVRSQTFHQTPEECAEAASIVFIWPTRGRTHKPTSDEILYQ